MKVLTISSYYKTVNPRSNINKPSYRLHTIRLLTTIFFVIITTSLPECTPSVAHKYNINICPARPADPQDHLFGPEHRHLKLYRLLACIGEDWSMYIALIAGPSGLLQSACLSHPRIFALWSLFLVVFVF